MNPWQTLIEYARAPWGRPHPGVIVDATSERIIEVMPSWPIPGPNSVSRLRCAPARIEVVIDEARERFASRKLPCMWILDPGASPADLPARLARRGIRPDRHSPTVSVMVLGAEATIAPARVTVEFRDALGSAQDFARAEAVQRAAFGSGPGEGGQAERLANARADPGHTLLLALVEGEAAGAAGGRLDRDGFMLRGGTVLPRFRGMGVYRALVKERLRLAGGAGAPGVCVWGNRLSAPILTRIGFESVGSLEMYRDDGTARGL